MKRKGLLHNEHIFRSRQPFLCFENKRSQETACDNLKMAQKVDNYIYCALLK